MYQLKKVSFNLFKKKLLYFKPFISEFCQTREECNDTEFCYHILENYTGIYVQGIYYFKFTNMYK